MPRALSWSWGREFFFRAGCPCNGPHPDQLPPGPGPGSWCKMDGPEPSPLDFGGRVVEEREREMERLRRIELVKRDRDAGSERERQRATPFQLFLWGVRNLLENFHPVERASSLPPPKNQKIRPVRLPNAFRPFPLCHAHVCSAAEHHKVGSRLQKKTALHPPSLTRQRAQNNRDTGGLTDRERYRPQPTRGRSTPPPPCPSAPSARRARPRPPPTR